MYLSSAACIYNDHVVVDRRRYDHILTFLGPDAWKGDVTRLEDCANMVESLFQMSLVFLPTCLHAKVSMLGQLRFVPALNVTRVCKLTAVCLVCCYCCCCFRTSFAPSGEFTRVMPEISVVWSAEAVFVSTMFYWHSPS